MGTQPQPAIEPPSQPNFVDQTRELLQFLREENEASRKAVREDAQASRELLRFTVWLVALPITALILVVGWFGFKSVSELKESLQREAEQSTKVEIGRMQGEIRTRLDDEFKTPALQKMVRTTAAEYTKTQAEPLIKGEVAAQVKSNIVAERPAIAAAVTQQTHVAVKQMEPQIKSLVKDSVDATVQTQVEPVTKRLAAMKADTDLQRLVIRMNNDDAKAFDQLIVIGGETSDPDTRQLINTALNEVVQAHDGALRLGWSFITPHTEEETFAELDNVNNASMRKTALSVLQGSPKLPVSKIVDIATLDSSLNVRCEAAKIFNTRVKQQFPCLFQQVIRQWWNQNKDKPEFKQP